MTMSLLAASSGKDFENVLVNKDSKNEPNRLKCKSYLQNHMNNLTIQFKKIVYPPRKRRRATVKNFFESLS